MAKDPAFLFYPGDYLRDTQCLSEAVQVAYDRIMCEHMRNICISHAQLNFFTKKLSSEEIAELKMVLTEVDGGYQIEWVAASILKRKSYSASRSKNRQGKQKHMKDISDSYVPHMENEIENEIEIVIEDKIEKKPAIEIPEGFPFETEYAKQAMRDYIQHRRQLKVKPYTKIGLERAMKEWQLWGEASFIEQVNETIRNNWQGIFPPKHISNNGQQRTQTTQRPTGRVEPSTAGTPFGKL